MFGRSSLERLLGTGRFQFSDSSASGRKELVRFKCGCVAESIDGELFRLDPCAGHQDCTP